jgi:hypothetical protein
MEGGVVERALAAHQHQEVGVPFAIQGQHLAVQDSVPHPELVPHVPGELIEALQDIPRFDRK